MTKIMVEIPTSLVRQIAKYIDESPFFQSRKQFYQEAIIDYSLRCGIASKVVVDKEVEEND